MSRTQRLSERFDVLKTSVEAIHGKELAFGAASAAWLQAIQYAVEQAMKQSEIYILDGVSKEAWKEHRESLDKINESLLRGFHLELCAYLGVDPARALKLAKHFEQVVRDICHQRG